MQYIFSVQYMLETDLMIKKITKFIEIINKDLSKWAPGTKPWFRGESDIKFPLCPKIDSLEHNEENYLLQSFRRKAGGLANVPNREHTDLWLFLAQHYGVPTRLLDWTEGALHALWFAINKDKFKEETDPRVYMLNPRKLNEVAGMGTYDLNYPLSWGGVSSALYVQLAWQNRDLEKIKHGLKEGVIRSHHYKSNDKASINQELEKIDQLSLKIPIAFPATYQDQRMIAQRSCFTIHGELLKPIFEILIESNINTSECIFEYKIDISERVSMLEKLSILGISAATIFPDLDHLAIDLKSDVEGF